MSFYSPKKDSDSNSLASSASLLRDSKQSNPDGSMKKPSFLSRHLKSSSNKSNSSKPNDSREGYPVSADPISMLYKKYPGMAASGGPLR